LRINQCLKEFINKKEQYLKNILSLSFYQNLLTMKKIITSLIISLLIFNSAAQKDQDIQKQIPGLVKTYRYLHQHPELSYMENKTAELLAKKMRKLGFEVTENFGGTGVVAILHNGNGPKILIRTDMDALPIYEKTGLPFASTVTQTDIEGKEQPVMHACGHDLHMSVWLGTAEYLSKHKDEWKGSLMMIAQPAEERGGGAKAMLEAGLYKKFFVPDYALAEHVTPALPAGMIGYRKGYAMANVDMAKMTIKGKGGHGAYPHKTIDPITMAAYYITDLQTIVSREVSPIESAVVTVGSIHGGTKGNIIPSEVKLEFTIRSYKDRVRKQVLDAMQRKANAIALSFNVPKEDYPVLQLSDTYTPALYNNPQLVTKITGEWKKAFGEKRIVEVPPVMGGEDFARYGKTKEKVPVFMFGLGAMNPQTFQSYLNQNKKLPSLHSDSVILDPAPALATGIKAFVIAVKTLGE